MAKYQIFHVGEGGQPPIVDAHSVRHDGDFVHFLDVEGKVVALANIRHVRLVGRLPASRHCCTCND